MSPSQNIFAALRSRLRRVPVLLQLEATECGAACLAMILSYYGRETRIVECRDSCASGRDGVGAQALVRAARSYGLRAQGFSLESGNLEKVRLPAIAHWNFNHFVVVERASPGRVEIVDPAVGRRRLSQEEFEAGFTGVLLILEPEAHFKPLRAESRSRQLGYLLAFLRPPETLGLILQILGASLCLLLLGLALPLLTKTVVDKVLPFHLTSAMPILGLGLVLIVLSQSVAGYLRSALLIFLRRRLDARMMLGFFEHLLSLPFRFFQQRSSGDLLMRLGSNVLIREALTGQTLSAFVDGTLVLGYLAVLMVQSPLFGWVALGTGLLQAGLLMASSNRLLSLTQRDLMAQSVSQSYLVETLSGVATLKASGTEGQALDEWSGLFEEELNASLRRDHFAAVLDTVINLFHNLAPLLLLWMGTMEVLRGGMSLGTMLALTALAGAFFEPLNSLVSGAQSLQLAAAHLERIADVVSAEPEQKPRTARSTPALRGGIEVRNVSFRYDANSPLVLRDVSFTIEPGQKFALAGRTGSGKSTLTALLLGLYEPTEGGIFYDGVPLRTMDYRAVRNQLGVILQEPFLLSGSIRQNISFGHPGMNLEQVLEAAKSAAIHEDIARMPMGYETRLAENGSGLSGGQRQRLALARALARKPAILFLDEATSQLDVVTENQVQWNLEKLNCTRVVIAHRLNTIRNADQIVVLEEGSIAERGTHAELMGREGRYSELVSSQTDVSLGRDSKSAARG